MLMVKINLKHYTKRFTSSNYSTHVDIFGMTIIIILLMVKNRLKTVKQYIYFIELFEIISLFLAWLLMLMVGIILEQYNVRLTSSNYSIYWRLWL